MKIEHNPPGAGDKPASSFIAVSIIERIARAGAIIGGTILLGMALIVCASVISRLTFGQPFLGIFEIVEILTGIAILSFFPYTQVMRGNVTAEFFTQRLSRRTRDMLDLCADLAFLAMTGFLFWRVSLGFIESTTSLNRTFILSLPEWLFYGPAALWLLLLVFAALAIAGDALFRILK